MSIFIDTNVFVAFFNKDDELHEKAKSLIQKIFNEKKYNYFITSDYVFDEAVTVALYKTKDIKKAKKLGEALLYSEIKLIEITTDIFEDAWKLFLKIGKMSFTDRSNIALMKAYGIKKIATFDKEFKKIDGINVVD